MSSASLVSTYKGDSQHLSLSDLLHWAQCRQGIPTSVINAGFPSFSRLNNIPVYTYVYIWMCIVFSLCISTFWWFPYLGYCEWYTLALWMMPRCTWGYRQLFEMVTLFPLDKCPEEGSLSHRVALFLSFGWPSILISTAAAPICIPTNSAGGSCFPIPLPTLLNSYRMDNTHSKRCEVIKQFLFATLHPSWGNKMERYLQEYWRS